VLVVGGGDSALEAALALSEQPGTKVTLSYRGDVFDRVKPKNRQRLDAASAGRRLQVVMGSTIDRIGAVDVALRQGSRSMNIPNEAVIVCAGGVLPFDLLKRIGIEFATKHGTA
jgi:thioredoxin reductase